MIKYIKSFSQGQITIPKEVRDEFGLGLEFWLRLRLMNKQIILEPVEKKVSRKDYAQTLLEIDGSWFDMKDYKKMRQEIRDRKIYEE